MNSFFIVVTNKISSSVPLRVTNITTDVKQKFNIKYNVNFQL